MGAPSVLADVPDGFIAPPLHPGGVVLETRQLGDGVYALVSNELAVDNAGFVVGERGVLVIDAHINGAMARQIQAAVRRITDKPILYLVNTNYHGDHTFGNYAFPASTVIIGQRNTAERMKHFEQEKRVLLPTVDFDESVYADVELRLPDVVFDRYVGVDLGGRTVEVHHFGAGNTPGDTIVYEPTARVAWTGNLVVGDGTIPPIFEGGTRNYLATVTRLSDALDIATIVPGHGSLTNETNLDRYIAYLGALLDAVGESVGAGKSLQDTWLQLPLDRFVMLPPNGVEPQVAAFLNGLHRYNVQQTYRDFTGR